MKALIIDDSSTMRLLLARLLDELGVTHAQAANGREAMEALAREGPFDFALVDWQMPVMDGIEFIRIARESYTRDELKLLMVTSVNQIESVMEALEAGADEYIMKPFSREALLEKLALLGIDPV
ncbi:MAG: response regulator [bacterium]|jgi:two-component system chemotaxis response regulator CheY|nr:response regulator [bacterium]